MLTRVVHLARGRAWRGGERQVWLLARELARQGGPPQLVLTGRGSALARRCRADGIPVREVAWRAGLDPRAFIAILSESRRPGSLLHAHDAHALRLAAWAAPRDVPLVATRRVVFPVGPGPWRRVSRAIAISEAVRQALEAGGVPADRITVIPSAIPVDETARAVPSGIRARLGWPGTAPVAVTVAALTPEKGHADLLEAAARLAGSHPALRWVLAGDGPERTALERQAARLGLRGAVHFAGHVDDVAGLLADATLVVSASRAEGLGSTLIDALALGRPVVATDAGGTRDLLGDGAGRLVPPGDPAALAGAVAALLDAPGEAAALAARARVAARRFDVAGMAERTRQVYRSGGLDP